MHIYSSYNFCTNSCQLKQLPSKFRKKFQSPKMMYRGEYFLSANGIKFCQSPFDQGRSSVRTQSPNRCRVPRQRVPRGLRRSLLFDRMRKFAREVLPEGLRRSIRASFFRGRLSARMWGQAVSAKTDERNIERVLRSCHVSLDVSRRPAPISKSAGVSGARGRLYRRR